MYKNHTNVLNVKLPRKIKKVFTSARAEHSYNRLYKKMSYNFNMKQESIIFKILNYIYYYDSLSYKDYKPSYPDIIKHHLYKVKNQNK